MHGSLIVKLIEIKMNLLRNLFHFFIFDKVVMLNKLLQKNSIKSSFYLKLFCACSYVFSGGSVYWPAEPA